MRVEFSDSESDGIKGINNQIKFKVMTPTKNEKDLALRGAENLNKLRIDANGVSSFFSEWVALFKEYKVPYYTSIFSSFVEQGILKEYGVKNHRGNMYSSYVIQDKPIHYSVLIPIYEKARNRGRVIKSNVSKRAEKRARTFSIANHGVSITSLDENKLKDFTDAELVSALRDRGYTVTAEKTTVIKL